MLTPEWDISKHNWGLRMLFLIMLLAKLNMKQRKRTGKSWLCVGKKTASGLALCAGYFTGSVAYRVRGILHPLKRLIEIYVEGNFTNTIKIFVAYYKFWGYVGDFSDCDLPGVALWSFIPTYRRNILPQTSGKVAREVVTQTHRRGWENGAVSELVGTVGRKGAKYFSSLEEGNGIARKDGSFYCCNIYFYVHETI
jgi:hypothetical protein